MQKLYAIWDGRASNCHRHKEKRQIPNQGIASLLYALAYRIEPLRPTRYECVALPTELASALSKKIIYSIWLDCKEFDGKLGLIS